MLSKKPLILTLVIAFSVHCSNGCAQENRLLLRFALAVGKALFPVRDGLADEQESEAIEWWELKVHSRVASDNGSNSEGSNTSDGSSDNRSNEGEDEANAESDVRYETTTLNPFRVANEISEYCAAPALKEIKQEPVSDSEIATNGSSDESMGNRSNEDESDVRYETTTLNPFRVSNEISQYCTTLELKKIKEEPVSDSEILTESEDAVKHQCDHEGCNYRTGFRPTLKRHNQIHLPADQRLWKYRCDYEGCNYRSDHRASLKRHKQTHLPADQRPNVHQCDHEDCNFSTDQREYLKKHKKTHLTADQRPNVHQCDHEGCNYSTGYTSHLKVHKVTHLPADQRPKPHQCDHEGCNYSSDRLDSLKRHKRVHLPVDQKPNIPKRPKRPNVHQCDHEGCDYSTGYTTHLKMHKQTHLPAEQRPKRKSYDQPSSNKKRKKGNKE
ncbi:hypothetical protein [Endozoicomonas sp. 4G]|uniref:hypothetical protein n=1 Tax=Endozoicomonas sp. 4G TaxID=2872754 RepID=UPI002078AFF1|nr:hypothetical protein [Endozoicomonas sp. 4G]